MGRRAAWIAVEPEHVNISLDLTPGIDGADAVVRHRLDGG
jgi:hypothetical protein